ncbi:Protein of unknown function YGGT [gamma proteobacterium HdN1]|nr:Protein of unknown function YGGT [gamma proteobacterium HdN1]
MDFIGTINLLLTYAFDAYIMIVIARFMLQMVRADFYNPLSQFVVKATKPLINPLRRMIPGVGGIDWASVVLFVAVVAVKIGALIAINGAVFDPLGFAILTLKSGVASILNFFLMAILIGAILSWVVQGYNPMVQVLFQVSEPVLAPFRRLLPAMGGMDFSPLLALLLLQAIKTLFQLNGVP